MKEIIYNEENIKDTEITQVVKRAKAIIVNSNNQLLLAYSNKNYFLIGGHVDNNESDMECLIREIKEESGCDISITADEPILSIKYYCKNYSTKNENTEYIANYYVYNYDLIPNLDNTNMTVAEKAGGFKLIYIDKDKILDELENNLKVCTKQNVVNDTIFAIKEYLEKDQ